MEERGKKEDGDKFSALRLVRAEEPVFCAEVMTWKIMLKQAWQDMVRITKSEIQSRTKKVRAISKGQGKKKVDRS